MSKRKGQGGGHEGEVIYFTPAPGFDIKRSSRHLAEMMEEQQLPLVIQLSKISIEFEIGCTPKEIVDGYNQGLKAQQLSSKPSNNNTTGRSKK